MAPSNVNANKVDAIERLQEEFKEWEKNHPEHFQAKPLTDEGGEKDWLRWQCTIPGKVMSPWQGGMYTLNVTFAEDYPYNPPTCTFNPPLFHPNIYPSGKVALSLLDKDWQPQITIKQVLIGIQLLLDDPNFQNPAQAEAFVVHSQGNHLYEQRIKEQAKNMSAAR